MRSCVYYVPTTLPIQQSGNKARLGAILKQKTTKNSKVFGLKFDNFGAILASTDYRSVFYYIVCVLTTLTTTNSAHNDQFAGFGSGLKLEITR